EWNHRPVHKRHEVRRKKLVGEFLPSVAQLNGFPRDFPKLRCLANHHLAVLKLVSVGQPRRSDRVNFRMRREVSEHRMECWIAERAHVSDRDSKTTEGVRHDGAVATKFHPLHHGFDVRALTSGGSKALRKFGDTGDALE